MTKRAVKKTDLIVIGGGLVGLSFAVLLTKEWRARGYKGEILIVERNARPKPDVNRTPPPSKHSGLDSRSLALSSSSIDLLKLMGVWSKLSPYATFIRKIHVSDRGHFGRVTMDANEQVSQAWGAVVEHQHIVQALSEEVEQLGISVIDDMTTSALQTQPEGMHVTLNSGQAYQCELLVLADGADNALREHLGIKNQVHDYQQSALITNVEYTLPHCGLAFERFTESGPLALLPLGRSDQGRCSALVWTHQHDQCQEYQQLSDTDFLAELQSAFGFRLGQFLKVGERVAYPLKRTLALEQVRSGLVLLGNAAHALHPLAGQGFNLALRDAAELTAVLAESKSDGACLGDLARLQAYLRKREPDQMATVQLSHSFNYLFSSASPAFAVARNLGLLKMELCPPIKSVLAQQMSGQFTARAPLFLWRASLADIL